MAEKTPPVIVFLGNVDNGKSTLIGRLMWDCHSFPKQKMAEIKRLSEELGQDVQLAFLTDQFKEERERGLTIDTTHVRLKVRSKTLTLIDVPGHEELLRNMISGSSRAQAAVLVLDVNEGLTEQAKRHLFITHFLGITPVLVAVNKMDSVKYDEASFERVRASILSFMKSHHAAVAGVVPVSAKDGVNTLQRSKLTTWYHGPPFLELLEVLPRTKPRPQDIFRFPVQDVYSADSKRILVGRVDSGLIRQKQKVLLLPSNVETTLEEVKVYGKKMKSAKKGESVGLVLSGDPAAKRGDVLFGSGAKPRYSDRLEKVFVFWTAPDPLRTGETYLLRCATQETECTVKKIRKIHFSEAEQTDSSTDALAQNEPGFVTLELARPLATESFDREESLGKFVIEKGEQLKGFGVVPAGPSLLD